jgi:hypothetical protein
VLTPPPFDPRPAIAAGTARAAADGQGGFTGPYVGYDRVLARYGDWLLSQRDPVGWNVIDLHEPLRAAEATARQIDPAFALSGDGIHPGPLGHWLIARQILRHWHADPDDDFPPPITASRRSRGPASRTATGPSTAPAADRYAEVRKLITRRRKLLSDAWLTHIGHKRPGMEKGLPVEEATAKAEEISREIDREVSTLIGRPRASVHNIRMPDHVEMFAFSKDGRWLATSKGALRLWDLHTGRVVAELQPDWFALAEPDFSPDGKFIGALDRQTTPPGPRVLRIWNLDGLVPPEVLHRQQ